MKVYVVNLEVGLPTVEQAKIRLDQGIRTARSQRYPIIKFIHGYGSSGKGGAIKKQLPALLNEQIRLGRITSFVSGENFSPFDPTTRNIMESHPFLYKDSDYSRGNAGITIVVV